MSYKDPAAQREYQRVWRANRRKTWFDANGPCRDCGSWEQLEIDHVDPAQKIDHKVWSWSIARMHAELAKCVVRCRDCHRDKTTFTNPARTTHGTDQMYRKHKCRCDICKAGKAARDKGRKR